MDLQNQQQPEEEQKKDTTQQVYEKSKELAQQGYVKGQQVCNNVDASVQENHGEDLKKASDKANEYGKILEKNTERAAEQAKQTGQHLYEKTSDACNEFDKTTKEKYGDDYNNLSNKADKLGKKAEEGFNKASKKVMGWFKK